MYLLYDMYVCDVWYVCLLLCMDACMHVLYVSNVVCMYAEHAIFCFVCKDVGTRGVYVCMYVCYACLYVCMLCM